MSSTDYAQKAQDYIKNEKFLVVSKSWCPDCVYAKKVFADLKAEPFVLEVDKLQDGEQLHKAFIDITNQRTVPNTFIDGEHIGTEDDIARLLANGELKSKLEKAGLIKN